MSLIINMLKDLEKRQDPEKRSPPMSLQNKYDSSHRFRFNYILIIPVAILLALLVPTIYIAAHIRTVTTVSGMLQEKSYSTSQNDSNLSESANISPTTISKISISANPAITEINIAMENQALYEIDTDTKREQIVILFKDIKNSASLPRADYSDSAIKKLMIENSDTTLKLVIDLQAGTIFQSAGIEDTDNKFNFKISLLPAKKASENMALTSGQIKTPALSTIIIDRYKNAIEIANSGNKGIAINKLTTLLQEYPDYNDARVSLAAILIETGKSSQASKIISDGLIISPDYIPLIELKARLLVTEGNISDALILLQNDPPSINDYPAYHAFIAALFNQQDNYRLAADIYEKLVRINPNDGSWWFGLGVSKDKLGSSKEAIFAYTKAATEGKLDPKTFAFLQKRLHILQEEPYAEE